MGADVQLTSGFTIIPLRIAIDPETKALAYREENVVGPDVLNPADGQQFCDVFDTWHLGGFIEEHVQNGLYFESRNVDCTKPGEIKPGPKRITTIECAKDANNHYGICGLMAWPVGGDLLVVVRSEDTLGDGLSERIYIRWVLSDHTFTGATDQTDLATQGSDMPGRTGFTSLDHPQIFFDANASQTGIIVPFGHGYAMVTIDAVLGTLASTRCHSVIQAGGRLFKVSLGAGGHLELSNMDVRADPLTDNWTAEVVLPALEAPFPTHPASPSINVLGEVPYVVCTQGLFTLGAGGFPFSILKALELDQPYGFGVGAALKPVAGGLALGVFGDGTIKWFTESFGTAIGPNTNPLATIETCVIMDMHEAPSGDLWVYVWYPDRSVDNPTDGVWELWVGRKAPGVAPGPGAYAWHQLLRDHNAAEGGPANDGTPRLDRLWRPFFPITWGTTPTAEIALGTGHSPAGASGTANAAVTTTDTTLIDTRASWAIDGWVGYTVTCNSKTMVVTGNTATRLTGSAWSGGGNPGNGFSWILSLGRTRLTFVDGGLFYDLAEYEHEDNSASYNVTVQWRSGRYSRQDRRVRRHWTELRFLGKNFGTAGNDGGRVLVEFSFDGGPFGAPPAGTTYLTSDDQSVSLNALARDIEYRLTWQLDGAATMNTAPATVTQVDYIGREVPLTLRRINLIVEGTQPQVAGGVRRHEASSDLYANLLATIDDLKMTFNDPFGVDRTVIALPPQLMTAGEVNGVHIPEGAIALSLLVVPPD